MLPLFIIMAAVDPTIGAIVIALVAPVGAYILAARQMSGKIATSEAKQLWEESRAIREWSTTEIKSLRDSLSASLSRISELEKQLNEAHEHIKQLESRLDQDAG